MPRSSTTFTKGNVKTNNNSPEARAKRNETLHINKLIKGEIFDEIRKAFLDPVGKSKTPFYQDFIREFVQLGIKDPNSPAGRLIAEQIFRDDIINQLDEQTEKYLNKDIDFTQFRLQILHLLVFAILKIGDLMLRMIIKRGLLLIHRLNNGQKIKIFL